MTNQNINPKSKYYKIQRKSQNQNTKNDKIYDIRDRTFQFAQRILDIAGMLSKRADIGVIRNQLVKSGTSISANVEEADGTVTKRDFINKMVIARKEAKETKYWLRLIDSKYIDSGFVSQDIKEAQEIINILSTIINNTRNSKM